MKISLLILTVLITIGCVGGGGGKSGGGGDSTGTTAGSASGGSTAGGTDGTAGGGATGGSTTGGTTGTPSDRIILDSDPVQYAEFVSDVILPTLPTTANSPALGGSSPAGLGVTPASGATPTETPSIVSDISTTPGLPLLDLEPRNPYLPIISGSFDATISSCTLVTLVTESCTISDTTFTATVDAVNLVGLSGVNLTVDGIQKTVPLQRAYKIQKLTNESADNVSDLFFASKKISVNGEHYFVMGTSTVYKLYKMNEATGEITRVANTSGSPTTSDGVTVHDVLNGEVYFAAKTSAGGSKLFKVNQAGVVTQMTNMTGNQATMDNISNVAAFNNEIHFRWTDTSGVDKFYKIDSSGNITMTLNSTGDIATANNGSILGVYSNNLFFLSTSPNALSKLYRYDTAGNMTMVFDSASTDNVAGSSLVAFNNKVYFTALNSSGFRKIFSLSNDGSVKQVSDNVPGANDHFHSPVVFNGELYFGGFDSGAKVRLMKISVNDEIIQLTNINSNGDISGNLVATPNFLFFGGYNSLLKRKVMKMDVNGAITQASNTKRDNNLDDNPTYLGVHNGSLYLTASTPSIPRLFKTDSATGELIQLTKLRDAITDGVSSSDFFFAGNRLVFQGRPPGANIVNKILVLEETP